LGLMSECLVVRFSQHERENLCKAGVVPRRWGRMSSGVMRAGARIFFMAGMNYTGIAGRMRRPVTTGRTRTSGRPAQGVRSPTRNMLKSIVNRRPKAHRRGKPRFFRIPAALACVLHTEGRPPVWRAVVRLARYFFSYCRVSAARRRTIGTNVSKSTGFGTCRSNPAAIAAATSPLDA